MTEEKEHTVKLMSWQIASPKPLLGLPRNKAHGLLPVDANFEDTAIFIVLILKAFGFLLKPSRRRLQLKRNANLYCSMQKQVFDGTAS